MNNFLYDKFVTKELLLLCELPFVTKENNPAHRLLGLARPQSCSPAAGALHYPPAGAGDLGRARPSAWPELAAPACPASPGARRTILDKNARGVHRQQRVPERPPVQLPFVVQQHGVNAGSEVRGRVRPPGMGRVEQPFCAHKVLDKMHNQMDRMLQKVVLEWPVSEILNMPEPTFDEPVWAPRFQFVFFNSLSCFQQFFS